KHEQHLQQEMPGPMQRISESDDRLAAVQQGLARLRGIYREAVTLRYIDGLSVEGVAVALGVSRETVKKRLARALGHLRTRMQEQGFASSLVLTAALLRRLRVPVPPQLAS